MDAAFLHFLDEVEDVAAMLALAETIPEVLAEAHPELGRVAALVDRARPIQAVARAFELIEQAIVLQDLLHGDGRLDGLEVNER